ncbi:hypothetical protein NADE_003116 [Nannochloris sp. 'desiccata']|nr:hypothetical protein KSW81_000830 [Chlorella desiccata (nom. nud.)]KAH7620498.1 hypothetical protein NADE_003116 [Chlorella desiccata (nom. nud.)]
MRGRPGHSGPSRRAPTCDVLVVNNQNLIDIDSEDSRDFPFYGNPEHIEAEIKEVQLLLLRTTPSTVSSLGVAASTASPPRVHNVKENKPWLLEKKDNLDTSIKKDNKLIKASYGHNAESVKEITEDNNRLVKRLIGKANAPLTFKTSAANHDKHMANKQASSARLRQKAEESVIQGNLWLYRKLQSVQASSNVDRSALEQFYESSRKYMPTQKREGPSVAPPGMLFQKSSWNDRWHVVQQQK